MNRAPGFSLVELVVVMVIAGILAAVAIPRFTDTESRAAWFAEQVRAGVRYAQRQAVAHRRCVFVTVNAAQVQLFYGDATCAITGTSLTEVATGNDYLLVAPNGTNIVLQSGASPFSFDGLGRPSGGVVLDIAGRIIIVNAETGYVQ